MLIPVCFLSFPWLMEDIVCYTGYKIYEDNVMVLSTMIWSVVWLDGSWPLAVASPSLIPALQIGSCRRRRDLLNLQ
jgi:hypothetical protein